MKKKEKRVWTRCRRSIRANYRQPLPDVQGLPEISSYTMVTQSRLEFEINNREKTIVCKCLDYGTSYLSYREAHSDVFDLDGLLVYAANGKIDFIYALTPGHISQATEIS